MRKPFERVKNFFSLSTLTKIIVIVLIIIVRLCPTLFDPENADWKKVLSNFIFSIVILMGGFISQLIASRKRETERENYISARNLHIDQIHLIQQRSLSHMHQLYVNEENKKNKLNYIKEIFNQYEIDFRLYDCDISLIKLALKNKEINKEQYSIIKICKRGNINYDKYDIKDLMTTQILKKSTNRNKSQQASITYSNILGKMSIMLALAVMFGMFVWDNRAEEGWKNGQAWIDLGLNLFTFAGGLITGNDTAREVAEDDIRLFNIFYNFNCKFVQDFSKGIWKPKANEISDDLIERLKRYDEEEKKSSEPQVKEIEITKEQYELLKPTLKED